MFRILAHVIINIIAILIIHEILPDEIYYENTETLVIFAVVLGLANAIVLPILQFIALPLTCLTLGLFAFVLSVAVFYFASVLMPGVEVTLLGAVIGSLLISVLSGVLDSITRR